MSMTSSAIHSAETAEPLFTPPSMPRTLIPKRSQEYEVEDDALPDSSGDRDEDEESLILSASTAAAAAALASGAEASMSMADIDMTQRAVFSRNHSSSRSAKQCSIYAIFRRVCIFLLLSTSLASLVTYLLRDRIDIGIGFGTLDLDTPLEWLGLHSAFVLETSDELPSYGADLLVYRHKKTDAKVAALAREALTAELSARDKLIDAERAALKESRM